MLMSPSVVVAVATFPSTLTAVFTEVLTSRYCFPAIFAEVTMSCDCGLMIFAAILPEVATLRRCLLSICATIFSPIFPHVATSLHRRRRVDVAVGVLFAELMLRRHRRSIVVRGSIHVGRPTIGMRLRLMRIVLAAVMILGSCNDRCRKQRETNDARHQISFVAHSRLTSTC
jgi:hypothetical protein